MHLQESRGMKPPAPWLVRLCQFYCAKTDNVHDHVITLVQVCEVLCQLAERYIKWPGSPTEMEDTAKGFKFPWTVGAVDGSHIHCKQPHSQIEAYTNRKAFTSVVLQAVCDSRMSFTDVSLGWPGSMHDARIFRLSNIGKRLERDGLQPYHLLGDSAYPLKTFLVVPFRDNGHLSAEEIRFNMAQSSTRIIIERAFARLKGKWRRLKYLDMENLSLMSTVIKAACVLHNFVIAHDLSVSDELDIGSSSNVASAVVRSDLSAAERRKELMYMLT